MNNSYHAFIHMHSFIYIHPFICIHIHLFISHIHSYNTFIDLHLFICIHSYVWTWLIHMWRDQFMCVRWPIHLRIGEPMCSVLTFGGHVLSGCRTWADWLACSRVLQRVAACCRVLQWVAVGCSGLHCVGVSCRECICRQVNLPCARVLRAIHSLHFTATHCNTLQRTATHCIALQYPATHCDTLQQARQSAVCSSSASTTLTALTAPHCNTQ